MIVAIVVIRFLFVVCLGFERGLRCCLIVVCVIVEVLLRIGCLSLIVCLVLKVVWRYCVCFVI